MALSGKSFKQIDAEAGRIGVIGSPSSTVEVLVDIMGHSVDQRLVGTLTFFSFPQGGKSHCAIGQITEILLRNLWVEDATMRSLIREKGRVDPITARQDTHTAKMSVGAVFAQTAPGFEQSQLGTIPATGTDVKRVDDALLDNLLQSHANVIRRIGRFYGNETLFPAWFRHFGEGERGVGEAYHLGIFGKTGSGKSVLAEILLMGFAQNPEMSIFVIDPQGQFYRDFSPGTPAREYLDRVLGKPVQLVNAKDICLTTDSKQYRLFTEILSKSSFFRRLGIFHPDNQERAAAEIAKAINSRSLGGYTGPYPVPPWSLHLRAVFDKVWEALGNANVQRNIYTSDQPVGRLAAARATLDADEMYETWARAARLFTREGGSRGHKIEDFVDSALEPGAGKFVVVDLSEEHAPEQILWDESVKLVVLRSVIELLRDRGEQSYKSATRLNALVLLDEAHRFAPRQIPEDAEELLELRRLLIDSVRTTRKYGLGWGFISQTLHSLDRELAEQIRIYIFGYGLAWGTERRALEEIMGGSDALRLYQTFRDPETSLGERQYPFMVTGPLSPLSFSGAPLFFTALRWPDEVLAQFGGAEKKKGASPKP